MHLKAGTIEAVFLDSDFLATNSALSYTSNQTVEIGNTDHVFIGGAPLNPTSIDITAATAVISGDVTVPGDIDLIGSDNAYIYNNSNVTAGGHIDLYATNSSAYIGSYSTIDVW